MTIIIVAVFIALTITIFIEHSANKKIDKISTEFARRNSGKLKLDNLAETNEVEEGKRPDRPDQAMQYEADLRSEIGKPFSYSGNWRMKALKEAKQISLFKSIADNMVWVERGPGNIGGRSRAIVVHPDYPAIWWVGAVGGGVWKTTDAGETWTCQTDDMPVLSATTIDICRNQPEPTRRCWRNC